MADEKEMHNTLNAPSEAAGKAALAARAGTASVPATPDPRWGWKTAVSVNSGRLSSATRL
jgi:hypothetical protein